MTHVARKCGMISVLFVFLLFNGFASAQDARDFIPGRDKKPTIQHLGPSKVIPVSSRDMFYYDEKGQKRELTQDFQFVGCQFKKAYADKQSRYTYYKNKVRLVVSELKEEELLERGIYGLRLLPGADENKWNVMAEWMRNDKELDFSYRVFSEVPKKGFKKLMFLTDRIELAFVAKPDEKRLAQLAADYPIEPVGKLEGNRLTVRMLDKKEDSINLANVMRRAKDISYAVPEFIEIQGRPVTKEDVDNLPPMPQDMMPMPDPTKPPQRKINPPRAPRKKPGKQ